MKLKILFLFCLCGLCSTAQQAKLAEYTLPFCLHTAIENNLSLKITRNKATEAANNATRSHAGMTPTASLSGGYQLSSPTTRTTQRNGVSSNTDMSFNQLVDLSADLNWTIFDGYQMQATYEQYKILRRQGEIQTRLDLEDLIANIATEYFNFVQQRIRLKNFRYAVKLSHERCRIAEERFLVGKGSGLEYRQATVDFNADSSQYVKQQELVKRSQINLNRLMSVQQVATPFSVPDTLIEVDEKLGFDELQRSMDNNNASLLMSASNNELAQNDLRKVMARDYPYLKLNAGYGYTTRFYSKGNNSKSADWGPQVGVTVGFKLFDGNRRREKRNAELEISNSQLEHEDLKLKLHADFNNLWQAYENNLKVLSLERENKKVAENNFEIAHDRYLIGDLSGIEMREAQKSLLDAHERILSAEYATKACEISLLQICGLVKNYLE